MVLILHRKKKKAGFSLKEAKTFHKKAEELMDIEKPGRAALFVFSAAGFAKRALDYMKQENIAWAQNREWLETNQDA
ncbi:conserved hypothetical protein [Candidatus Desulfarcum epimagneticum]|uniref:Restriction endonuclease type IV Mrr domain-containing protein n=1 Tax=uncultured Desulfobacteraceae bacterium TaxID=218296 RepID=A0A484HDY1_9BACT|nr:conserved hypothetical protein [uncultured Desulfobacteraceae bacterium]